MRLGRVVVMVVIALLAPWTLMATHVPPSTEKITYDGPLSPGAAATGTIGWADPIDGYDWYCFDVTKGTAVNLSITRSSGDIFPNVGVMKGLADEKNPVANLPVITDTSNSNETSTTATFTPTDDGPVTMWVSTFLGEKQGDYSVTMTGGTARSACSAAATGVSGPLIEVSVPEIQYFTSNDQSITIPVTVNTVTGFAQNVTLGIAGLGDEVTKTFSPVLLPAPGSGRSDLTLKIAPLTLPNTYNVFITATGGDATGGTTFLLTVDCGPPTILGLDQPKDTTVNRGSTTKLTVKPSGTGPFFYQWFAGYAGLTAFPIKGATSPTLTTPAINNSSPFWVRITNACGSVDSRTVNVQASSINRAPTKE
ncbi:MAG: hypothetical protein ACXV7D_15170 [Thermoanaerobaculia bacterium]